MGRQTCSRHFCSPDFRCRNHQKFESKLKRVLLATIFSQIRLLILTVRMSQQKTRCKRMVIIHRWWTNAQISFKKSKSMFSITTITCERTNCMGNLRFPPSECSPLLRGNKCRNVCDSVKSVWYSLQTLDVVELNYRRNSVSCRVLKSWRKA